MTDERSDATHFVEVCRCGLCTMRAAAVGEGV
jgi:hypothetical protein